MRCHTCNRALGAKPFVSMPGPDGQTIAWGPVCGRRLVLAPRRHEKEAPSMKPARASRWRDGLTADLFEGAAA